MEADRTIGAMDAAGRAELVSLALKGLRASEAEKQAAAASVKEMPKAATQEDAVSALREELKAMREERAAEKRQAESQQREAKFYGTINDVLDRSSFKGDADIREEITDWAIGRQLRGRPADIKAEVEAKVKQIADRMAKAEEDGRAKGKGTYVSGKVSDLRATRGENGSGSPPSKTEKVFKGSDFSDPRDKNGLWEKFNERFAELSQ